MVVAQAWGIEDETFSISIVGGGSTYPWVGTFGWEADESAAIGVVDGSCPTGGALTWPSRLLATLGIFRPRAWAMTAGRGEGVYPIGTRAPWKYSNN